MATEMSTYGCCCVAVETGQVGVVQQWGRFMGYKNPGLSFFCPPIQTVSAVSVQIKQIECLTDCKTLDNVTLTVRTAIQFKLDKANVEMGVFGIENPEDQIRAAVDDVVRSSIPNYELDQTYSNKDTLTAEVLATVQGNMAEYGWAITNALITDLAPDSVVLASMNMINTAKRQRMAAVEQGEGAKTLMVKAAEADSDAKFLSGQGVARQRVAIATGFKEGMSAMTAGGLTPQEAISMMITTQYLDTMKDFATNASNSSIMVAHSPGAIEDIQKQVARAINGI